MFCMTTIKILAVAAALYSLPAQTSPAINFDTITIAPNHSQSYAFSGRVEASANQPVTLTLHSVTLKFCVQQAYGVKEYQVSGLLPAGTSDTISQPPSRPVQRLRRSGRPCRHCSRNAGNPRSGARPSNSPSMD